MSPENQWLEDVFPTKIVPFWGHVSFQGCINTRGNGKQQEEEGEETETEETGQDFHFFETFFLTSKHELLTCFGHLRCCKLRKVPLPHHGFNLVSFFFQRNFPHEERRHTWSDTFFSWMEYIVGISQAEVFFFFLCVILVC